MEEEKTHFDLAFDRIKALTGGGINNYIDLAKALDITQPSVSGAKKRGKFPPRWAQKIAKSYGLSFEDIMEGPKNIPDPNSENQANYQKEGIEYKEFDRGNADIQKTQTPEEFAVDIHSMLHEMLGELPKSKERELRGFVQETYEQFKKQKLSQKYQRPKS